MTNAPCIGTFLFVWRGLEELTLPQFAKYMDTNTWIHWFHVPKLEGAAQEYVGILQRAQLGSHPLTMGWGRRNCQ